MHRLSKAWLFILCGLSCLPNHSVGQDNGNAGFRPATTVQQPTFGISIDADGVLKARNFSAPGTLSFPQRAQRAAAKLDADIAKPSSQRLVSIRRLSESIVEELSNGELAEATKMLAGLTSIESVYVVPSEKDIFLAGPAEGWVQDASGRYRGISSGAPIILLEDLVVALEHQILRAPKQGSWCGCTINPKEEALANLVKFNRTIPKAISQNARARVVSHVVRTTQDTLGLADVIVFSLPPQSNMARVLVEADYRMKLTAVGLEPPPAKMKSFYSRLSYPPRSTFQRWWFTPNYQCLTVSPDELAMRITSDSVTLQTQDYDVTKSGQLFHTGDKPSAAARGFAKSFTQNYSKIGQARPIFAQLKNMVDLLVVGAYLNHVDGFRESQLEDSILLQTPEKLVPKSRAPSEVPCVANGGWKGNQMIAVAGGGVSINATEALKPENVTKDPKFEPPPSFAGERWWWDIP